MIEGFWTYSIPGANRGGTLVIRNGLACGGDNINYFTGLVSAADSVLRATLLLTRFIDAAGEKPTAWGDAPARYSLTFEGEIHHNLVIGKARRGDMPGMELDMVLERRGACP